MSHHAVEELNEVQCSKSFRDALISAVVAVCRQVFSFSNYVRIDGRISFIIDDFQVTMIMYVILNIIVHQFSNPILLAVWHFN